jgi:hypothetical protein
MLWRIFRSKKEERTGGWRKLHNEELLHLYSAPNIIREIKSDVMGGTCNIHRNVEMFTKFEWESLNQRDHLDGIVVDVRVMLKGGLQEIGCGWADWIHLAYVSVHWWAIS